MYHMLKGLLAVKVHVDSKFPFDWGFIEKTVEALEPIAILTTKMQKEVYVMGDFFRDLLYCRIELRRFNTSARKLRELLEVRSEKLLSSNAYAAAMLFDPRFNIEDSIAINDAQRESRIVSYFILSTIKAIALLIHQYHTNYNSTSFITEIFDPEIQADGAYCQWKDTCRR